MIEVGPLFVASIFVAGFWAGLYLCRYGVTLIARDYPEQEAITLFRRENVNDTKEGGNDG